MSGRLKTAFWICLIAFPIFSGSFQYPWSRNETYDSKLHILLATQSKVDPNDNIVLVPDTWLDRRTGEVFTKAEFAGKRLWVAFWSAVKLAVLVTAGVCFQFASERPIGEYDRNQVWLAGGMTWIILAGLGLLYALV